MPIFQIEQLEKFEMPGITHRTVAGPRQGVESMEVWVQTIAPGAATPVHRHACEEVVVVLTGSGECTEDGVTRQFGPDTTLVIAPDVVHRIVNTSAEDLRLVSALGMAPVRVKTADGKPLPVPWEAPSRT